MKPLKEELWLLQDLNANNFVVDYFSSYALIDLRLDVYWEIWESVMKTVWVGTFDSIHKEIE